MGRLGKAKWCLLGCLIVVFLFLVGSFFFPDWLTGVVKSIAYNDFTSGTSTLPEGQPDGDALLVEMVVDKVGLIEVYDQPVVVLKERGGDRLRTILYRGAVRRRLRRALRMSSRYRVQWGR